MGPPWGPPGSCRPQMGPMLAPWNLQSGSPLYHNLRKLSHFWMTDAIALLPTPHACRIWESMSLESTQRYLYNLIRTKWNKKIRAYIAGYTCTLWDGPEYDQPQNVLIEFCCLSAIVWNGQNNHPCNNNVNTYIFFIKHGANMRSCITYLPLLFTGFVIFYK